VNWPVRPEISDRFEEAVKVANVVNDAWNAATDEDRVAQLLRCLRSDVYEVSLTAVDLLSLCAPTELMRVCEDVVKLPDNVRLLTLIDERLCDSNIADWQGSDQRTQVLDHLLKTAKTDAKAGSEVWARLTAAIRNQQIEPEALLRYVEDVMKCDECLESLRGVALRSLIFIVPNTELRVRVFDLAVLYADAFRGASRIREAATVILERFDNLTAEQLTPVRALQAKAREARTLAEESGDKAAMKVEERVIQRLQRAIDNSSATPHSTAPS